MPKFQFTTKPFKHQKECFDVSAEREAFALFGEMGTGKSKVFVDTGVYLHFAGEIDAIVLIAPKSMYHQWVMQPDDDEPGEWEKHAPKTLVKCSRRLLWRTGGGVRFNERTKNLLKPREGWIDFVVINTEQFSYDTGASQWLTKFLKARSGRVLLGVDESTLIKNTQSKRTKRIVALGGYANYRRILSGSAMANSPLDVFGQFKFLDAKILGSSFVNFRSRFAVLEEQYVANRSFKVVIGYRDTQYLRKLIIPHLYRTTKAECLDLPAKQYFAREVDVSGEQRALYNQLVSDAFVVLEKQGKLITAPYKLSQIMKQRQVLCGFIFDEEGVPHWLVDAKKNARLRVLFEYLDECLQEKVVIYTTFKPCVEMITSEIARRYNHPSSVRTWVGGRTPKQRKETQTWFNNDPEARWLVCTTSSVKYGLNLSASNVVYYDNDYDLDMRLQSEDRTHGIGRGKAHTPTVYTDLVHPNSVDTKIRDALIGKKNLSDEINGDKWREWLQPI